MTSFGFPDDPRSLRRFAFHLASMLELTRDDRLELASYLLGRDIDSWRILADEDWRRVVDALHGYLLVRHLRSHHE